MHRPSRAVVILGLASVAVAAVSLSGCMSALTTAVYLWKGTDIEADYKLPEKAKIAVVCRPLVSLSYSTSGAANDIASELGKGIKANYKKVKVIDQQKIAEWTDEHSYDEFTEIGEALEADMVIGVDLEYFSIYSGQTLYQGKADCTVRVYDMKKGGEVVFEKKMPQFLYPPNHGMPTSDLTEDAFRRRYEGVLAEEIGHLFYSHDSKDAFARDSQALIH